MEVVTCIFCDKLNYEIAIEDNGYTGRRCTQCGLVYISPRPSPGEIVDLYGHDRSGISAAQHIASSHIKRIYARNTLRILRKYVACGSLLEIGAGAGYFLDEAREAGFDVHGIELNSLLATFMRNHLKIPCEESPLDVSSFDGKKFDVIYHCDVLSHFYDPIADFTRMRDRLKEKGIIAFETGNCADVQKRFYRFIDSFLYPEHLSFFGERSLLELLRRTGFELIVKYRTSLMPYYLWRKLDGGISWLRSEVLPKWPLVKGLKKGRDWLRSSQLVRQGQNSLLITQNVGRNIGKAEACAVSEEPWGIRARNHCTYFTRYKLGGLAPKVGRPQSLLVIARKM